MQETGEKEEMCGATLVGRFRARRPNVCRSYCDADLAVLMEEAVSEIQTILGSRGGASPITGGYIYLPE